MDYETRPATPGTPKDFLTSPPIDSAASFDARGGNSAEGGDLFLLKKDAERRSKLTDILNEDADKVTRPSLPVDLLTNLQPNPPTSIPTHQLPFLPTNFHPHLPSPNLTHRPPFLPTNIHPNPPTSIPIHQPTNLHSQPYLHSYPPSSTLLANLHPSHHPLP